MEYLVDQDEVNALIAASNEVIVAEVKENPSQWYRSYSQEEVNALIAGNYDPAHFDRNK